LAFALQKLSGDKGHAPKAPAVNESSMWLVAGVFAATLQA